MPRSVPSCKLFNKHTELIECLQDDACQGHRSESRPVGLVSFHNWRCAGRTRYPFLCQWRCFLLTSSEGYWMPFEAAKAIATIFCWKIRFALIPLFGPEIVEQCVHPDHPAYKQFVIDANITKRCMREQKKRGAKTNRNVSNVNAYQTEPPTPSSLPSTSQIMSKTRPLRSRRPSSLRLPDTDMSDNSSVVSTSHDCTPTAQADEQPYVTMGNAEQRDRQQPQTPPQTPTANPLPPTRGQNKKRDHSGFDTDVESGSTSTFSTPKARKRKVDVGVITRDDIRAACQLMALRYGSRWMHVRAF